MPRLRKPHYLFELLVSTSKVLFLQISCRGAAQPTNELRRRRRNEKENTYYTMAANDPLSSNPMSPPKGLADPPTSLPIGPMYCAGIDMRISRRKEAERCVLTQICAMPANQIKGVSAIILGHLIANITDPLRCCNGTVSDIPAFRGRKLTLKRQTRTPQAPRCQRALYPADSTSRPRYSSESCLCGR